MDIARTHFRAVAGRHRPRPAHAGEACKVGAQAPQNPPRLREGRLSDQGQPRFLEGSAGRENPARLPRASRRTQLGLLGHPHPGGARLPHGKPVGKALSSAQPDLFGFSEPCEIGVAVRCHADHSICRCKPCSTVAVIAPSISIPVVRPLHKCRSISGPRSHRDGGYIMAVTGTCDV